jgi:hypothetical protein
VFSRQRCINQVRNAFDNSGSYSPLSGTKTRNDSSLLNEGRDKIKNGVKQRVGRKSGRTNGGIGTRKKVYIFKELCLSREPLCWRQNAVNNEQN